MSKLNLQKFDHTAIGVVIGVILPVTAMHLILSYYSNFTIEFLIENPLFSGILDDLKGCLFINLGLFFVFYLLRMDKAARGVVFATFLYGAIYLYYMFFM